MGKLKIAIAVFSAILLLTAMTACTSKDDEVYGKITKINDTKITVETGAYEEPPKLEKNSSTQSETGSQTDSTSKADNKAADSHQTAAVKTVQTEDFLRV